ncbi:hypothetical protein ABA31_17860 [Agrococcus baldri]|uniref:Uncharacterized protein n=1 Tax=Agrococcus baldri TaxID=153730 RepID=A0AA87RC77_9MICO|nr:hypothetical protein ABA31_17860 [Agrococcus baldri]
MRTGSVALAQVQELVKAPGRSASLACDVTVRRARRIRNGRAPSCGEPEAAQSATATCGLRMPGCDFGMAANSTQPETATQAMMSG